MVRMRICPKFEVFSEFREFISRGSVVDLAIAFFLSQAMNAVVTSVVQDIFSPIISITCDAIGLSNGRVRNFYIVLQNGPQGGNYNTLQEAHADDAITINHGQFILILIDFFSISFICFAIASAYLKVQKEEFYYTCNECLEPVKKNAIRCKHCTCVLAPLKMERHSIGIEEFL